MQPKQFFDDVANRNAQLAIESPADRLADKDTDFRLARNRPARPPASE
jgi:hypothetical protein